MLAAHNYLAVAWRGPIAALHHAPAYALRANKLSAAYPQHIHRLVRQENVFNGRHLLRTNPQIYRIGWVLMDLAHEPDTCPGH